MEIDPSVFKNNSKEFSKIMFIFNAIEDGWSVKKRGEQYIFKKHKCKEKHIYNDDFLENFVKKYFKL
tara:strand:+ start:3083 stop:3283 length:201 start_codon:yes stop_codon:yes gene_type:complete